MYGRKNLAVTTIAAAPTPGASGFDLTLQAGTGKWMPPAPFRATMWPPRVGPTPENAEVVIVGSVTGDAVVLSARGQGGTVAQAIEDGWQFANTETAEDFDELVAAIAAETERAKAAEALMAPLASPVLTGNPTAPTQAAKDNSTKLANTSFVATAVANIDGGAAI